MTKSENARATTSMLDGVRRLLVLKKCARSLSGFRKHISLDQASLEKDVEHHAVSERANDPEDEEPDGQDVLVERVDRWEGQPVRVGMVQNVLRGVESMVGACNTSIFCL